MKWQFYFPKIKRPHTLYAGSFDEYKYVNNLFQEAVSMVGTQDLNKVFGYMAPKLKQKGLNPRKWINWVFNKRIVG